MLISNFSTNAFVVTLAWPDNSTQQVVILPGHSAEAPGFVDATNGLWNESWAHRWQAVNDDVTGFHVHDCGSVQNLFLNGCSYGAFFGVFIMAAWAARMGLKARIED